MNNKSFSLPKLTTSPYIIKEDSLFQRRSRLNFPKPGDSSIFANVGRKHFEKNTEKMFKIILPEKFALQKPLILKRQPSLPPPHLIRSTSERDNKNSEFTREFSTKLFSKEYSLRQKIEDELDKMKRSMELEKNIHKSTILTNPRATPRSPPSEKIPEKPLPVSKVQQIQSYQSYSFSPSKIEVSPPKITSEKSTLLYNPQNKGKYDRILEARAKNPTHLSVGLSII